MATISWILIAVVVVALIFDYTNGFHDAANAIATSIGTRALRPTTALAMAAVLNVVGGLIYETHVADTMTKIVSHDVASQELVLAALVGAILWNVFTWWAGIPSSSSHALIGGLVGAALAASFQTSSVEWAEIVSKVILPTIGSPIVGLVGGMLVTTILYRLVHGGTGPVEWAIVRFLGLLLLSSFFAFILNLIIGKPLAHFEIADLSFFFWYIPAAVIALLIMKGVIGKGPAEVNGHFRHLQTLSAGFMALEHGHNDAQKTMGIITLALIAEGTIKVEDGVPLWVKLACAIVIGLGTFSGGKRIIKTMGMKLVKLQPIDGFAAETVAATVIQVAGVSGMPISTTHAITASITGVGVTKRISAVKWGVTGQIMTAWVLTLPAAALISAACFFLIHAIA